MCSRAADSRDGYLLSVVVVFPVHPFRRDNTTFCNVPIGIPLEYSPLGITATVQVT